MTVPDSLRLHNSLEALRQQLDELPPSDAAAVARLRATLADIETALSPQAPPSEPFSPQPLFPHAPPCAPPKPVSGPA